jgi:hypothetical protein
LAHRGSAAKHLQLHSYTVKPHGWAEHSLSGGLNGSLGSYRVVTTRGNGDDQMRYGNIALAPGSRRHRLRPNQVTLALSHRQLQHHRRRQRLLVTDRMTYKRATITAGLRFDLFGLRG